MPVLENTFEGGTVDASITTGNSSSGGTAFSAVEAAMTYASTPVDHGTRSAKCPASSSTAVARWALGGVDAVAFRVYRFISAAHTSDHHFVRISHTTDTTALTVLVNGANTLRVNDKSGTKWTADAALPTSQWIRIEGYVVQGASSSSGTMTIAYYLGDSTTPIQTANLTGLNLGGDLGDFSNFRFGKISGDTPPAAIYYDSVKVHTAADATGLIGPFSAPLATPTVTLTGSTGPTSIGGSNGTATVSWPAVSGAGAYDAYKAAGTSPAQEDFTLVASGVTSPYTFTGLSAGGQSVGIKARP